SLVDVPRVPWDRGNGDGLLRIEAFDDHRWDSPQKIRFAPDSPLEESGLEPLVPGHANAQDRPLHLFRVPVPSGETNSLTGRDLRFESRFLQQRVRSELLWRWASKACRYTVQSRGHACPAA